jgi:citrate synthase
MSYVLWDKDKYGRVMKNLSRLAVDCSLIDPELYGKYDVKRGLRDISGQGVLAGLSEIGEVHSYIMDEGKMVPVPGKLFYRGIDIDDIIKGFMDRGDFGFEETGYLLLFGDLPNKGQLEEFKQLLSSLRCLPDGFVRDTMMNIPSTNMLNAMARCVLALYGLDENADDTSVLNVLAQCLKLIAVFPLL